MGQIYVNPFSSNFRFSLSVVTFALFIYWYQELKIVPTAVITGLFLLFFRVFIQFTQSPLTSILTLIGIHYQVLIYYTTFGFLLNTLKFRTFYDEKYIFIFILSFSDSLSNVIEFLIRREPLVGQAFFAIFFVGIIRGFITLLIIEAFKYYEMLLMKEQHEERYKQLVLLTSNLKSEVFFLKKSMDDMEAAMVKSYQLYDQLKNLQQEEFGKLSFTALSIARDIHEIKKDYLRVSAGLEKVIPEIEAYEGMTMKDVINIIESSFAKTIATMDKVITLEFIQQENLFLKNAYEVISIMNNLIINAIEAIRNQGSVTVMARIQDQNLEIIIHDNGEGIQLENLKIIFEAGYTTKFDHDTGKMSTGIGLTHVMYLVTNHFKGTINVSSDAKKGTSFTVKLPIVNV